MIHLPHPYGRIGSLSIAADNPLRDAPQSSYGMKWCCRCRSNQPSKGAKRISGIWTCAKHLKEAA